MRRSEVPQRGQEVRNPDDVEEPRRDDVLRDTRPFPIDRYSLRVEGHGPETSLCFRALLAGGGRPCERTTPFLDCSLRQLVGLLVAVDANVTGDPMYDHTDHWVSHLHQNERLADREADCLAGRGSGVDRALDGREVVWRVFLWLVGMNWAVEASGHQQLRRSMNGFDDPQPSSCPPRFPARTTPPSSSRGAQTRWRGQVGRCGNVGGTRERC